MKNSTAGKWTLSLIGVWLVSFAGALTCVLLLAPHHVPSDAEFQASVAELRVAEVYQDRKALAKLGPCDNVTLTATQSGSLGECRDHRWQLVGDAY